MRAVERAGRIVALAALTSTLAACLATGPEARRAAYLECARDQGLTVQGGTIRTTGPEELARLDACRAEPR